jgi:hypothetical protein
LDFPHWLDALHDAEEKAQRQVAISLGHNERVDLLVNCGMERERAEIGDLIDNETMTYCLSTWLFDCLGHYEVGHDIQPMLVPCEEFWPEGVQAWKEGRHDT